VRLEEAATEEILVAYMPSPKATVFLKKVVKTTLLRTLQSSLVLPSKNVLIALTPKVKNPETPVTVGPPLATPFGKSPSMELFLAPIK
jgi:hypothetical protein